MSETISTPQSTAALADGQPDVAIDAIQPRRIDKQIWAIYLTLCLVSVVELYTASSHEVTEANVFAPVVRHVSFLAAGLVMMLGIQNIHYVKFRKPSFIFALISVLAMVYTLFYGDYINGARRSFSVGHMFAVQPSEMVKISVVLAIAAVLSKTKLKKVADVSMFGIIVCTVIVGVAGALLFTQGLTNTLLLMAISLSMMLIGGVPWRKLFMVAGLFAVMAGGFLGVKTLLSRSGSDDVAVQREIVVPGTNIVVGIDEDAARGGSGRMTTWQNRLKRHFKLDKYNDPIDDTNQQEQYSYIAQAHGGLLGVMPGNSRETARLPLAFSDYIYAIIIEEMGLVGGICILVLYLWLLARAARIANRCQTLYPALLVIGMAVFITFQAIFHMCIVTGVFPVSGQPLPLISKGGTSILITSVALGIMLSVSRFAARKGQNVEIKEEKKVLDDNVSAENPI